MSVETKVAHTPGPWGVSSSFIVCDEDARIIANCIRLGISELDVPFEQGVANARLIAAAPEMYLALKELLESHDRSCPGEKCGLMGVDLGKLAIAKAEGR